MFAFQNGHDLILRSLLRAGAATDDKRIQEPHTHSISMLDGKNGGGRRRSAFSRHLESIAVDSGTVHRMDIERISNEYRELKSKACRSGKASSKALLELELGSSFEMALARRRGHGTQLKKKEWQALESKGARRLRRRVDSVRHRRIGKLKKSHSRQVIRAATATCR